MARGREGWAPADGFDNSPSSQLWKDGVLSRSLEPMELRSLIGIFGGPSTGLRSELLASFVLLGQASFGMLRVGLRPGDTHHKLLGDKLLERGCERCERGESENPRILLAWAPTEDFGERGESENPRILLVGAIAEDVVSLRLGFFLIGEFF